MLQLGYKWKGRPRWRPRIFFIECMEWFSLKWNLIRRNKSMKRLRNLVLMKDTNILILKSSCGMLISCLRGLKYFRAPIDMLPSYIWLPNRDGQTDRQLSWFIDIILIHYSSIHYTGIGRKNDGRWRDKRTNILQANSQA